MKLLAFIKNPITIGVTATVAVLAVAGFVTYKVVKGKKVEVIEDSKTESAQ